MLTSTSIAPQGRRYSISLRAATGLASGWTKTCSALPERRAYIGVQAVHDVTSASFGRVTASRSRRWEWTGSGQRWNCRASQSRPLASIAALGIAVSYPAVRAICPEEGDQVIGEVVAAGFGRRPSEGDRELRRGARAEEADDPCAVEDGACRVQAGGQESLVVPGWSKGSTPGRRAA